MTSDQLILNLVRGYEIPFKSIPLQIVEPNIPSYSEADKKLIDESIKKLLKTGAIFLSENEPGQFLSTIFTVPKPDGTSRPILNLKMLNLNLDSPHFKMETIKTTLELVAQKCFMAVIDLKDAYHAIPIGEKSRKFLKFKWKGNLYEYQCLPFGLSLAPFLYTKLMKPIVAKLRSQGILLISYLDDMLVFGNSFDECKKAVETVKRLLKKVGFTINVEKSQLVPCQRVKYLGFIIDSINMTIELPEDKVVKIYKKCREAYDKSSILIQKVAELIGTLVAAVPANKLGLLYTRQLEIEKIKALQESHGSFNSKMILSEESRLDLLWWIDNIYNFKRSILQRDYDHIIFTDASLAGWGAEMQGKETKGAWPLEFHDKHINVLELYEVLFGLKSLVKGKRKHILIRVDNTSSLCYVNRYGGCKQYLHDVAKLIWQWAEFNDITLVASYINTKDNVIADRLSREKLNSTDFMLSGNYFQKFAKSLGFQSLTCLLLISHQNV